MTTALLIGATFLLAGLVKGVIGMGLPTVAMGLLALVPALIGMQAGQWLRRRIAAATFRRVFFAGLLLLGATLALA